MLRYDPNPDTVLSHERNLLFAGGVIGRIGNGDSGGLSPGQRDRSPFGAPDSEFPRSGRPLRSQCGLMIRLLTAIICLTWLSPPPLRADEPPPVPLQGTALLKTDILGVFAHPDDEIFCACGSPHLPHTSGRCWQSACSPVGSSRVGRSTFPYLHRRPLRSTRRTTQVLSTGWSSAAACRSVCSPS